MNARQSLKSKKEEAPEADIDDIQSLLTSSFALSNPKVRKLGHRRMQSLPIDSKIPVNHVFSSLPELQEEMEEKMISSSIHALIAPPSSLISINKVAKSSKESNSSEDMSSLHMPEIDEFIAPKITHHKTRSQVSFQSNVDISNRHLTRVSTSSSKLNASTTKKRQISIDNKFGKHAGNIGESIHISSNIYEEEEESLFIGARSLNFSDIKLSRTASFYKFVFGSRDSIDKINPTWYNQVSNQINEDYLNFLETRTISNIIKSTNKTTIKITIASLLSISTILSTISIITFVFNTTLSSILVFNFIHALLLFLGNSTIYFVYNLQEYVATSIIADDLLHGKTNLALIGMNIQDRVPESNRKLRSLVIYTTYLFAICLVVLSLLLHWKPVSSLVGDSRHPCVEATYKNISIPDINIGNHLIGQLNQAKIYNYGLPLIDGIIGGWSALPLYSPPNVKEFSIKTRGILYAIKTRCNSPTVIDPLMFPGVVNTTRFRLDREVLVKGSYSTMIYVAYPSNSHDYFVNKDIQQSCRVEIVLGNGILTRLFKIDEWNVIVPGNLVNASVKGKIEALLKTEYPTDKPSNQVYFDQFEDIFFKDKEGDFDVILGLIRKCVSDVFNRGYKGKGIQMFASINGIYETENTWKGLSAGLSAVSNFVLMQYDKEDSIKTCLYFCKNGAGLIEIPSLLVNVVLVVGMWLVVLILYQMIWWKLSFESDENVDKACQCLNLPLRLIVESAGDAKNWKREGFEISDERLIRTYSKTLMRLGEIKESRKDALGVIGVVNEIQGSKKVMGLIKGRRYF